MAGTKEYLLRFLSPTLELEITDQARASARPAAKSPFYDTNRLVHYNITLRRQQQKKTRRLRDHTEDSHNVGNPTPAIVVVFFLS